MKTASKIGRTPPKHIRLALRKEVGFGCPICGSPHLEYHHFDPPWAEIQHHAPEGMIALCARHHDEADSGAFTKQQLRDLKKLQRTHVQSKFNWKRRHTIFDCGGNYAYQCGAMLTSSGIDMIYFEKDSEGYDTLSLNIYDVCLNPIVVMRQNDWLTRTDIDEVEAAPRTPQLIIRSKIHRIDLKIDFLDRVRMDASEQAVAAAMGIPPEDNVLLVKLRGEIPAPCHAKFTDKNLTVNGRMQFSGQIMVNFGKGIVLG
jgi:hypothetical protein